MICDKLTIIIPVYNEVDTLETLIKNVESVEVPIPKEIIIIDDASTDGSQLIILVCDSQVRYCLDFSICPVTVTTSSEFGICISVPLECGITNPF